MRKHRWPGRIAFALAMSGAMSIPGVAAGAELPPQAECAPYVLSKAVTPVTDPRTGETFSRVDYQGTLACNEFVAIVAEARLVDQTPGSENAVLSTGKKVELPTGGSAVSGGTADIHNVFGSPLRRQAEVVFQTDLTASPAVGEWQSCPPSLSNGRVLDCTGLGTSRLHVEIGSNPFFTDVPSKDG